MKTRVLLTLAALLAGMSMTAFAAAPTQATWLIAMPDGSWWRPPALPRGCMEPLAFRAQYDWALPADMKSLVAAQNRACGKANVMELIPSAVPNQCYQLTFGTEIGAPIRLHHVDLIVASIKCKRAKE